LFVFVVSQFHSSPPNTTHHHTPHHFSTPNLITSYRTSHVTSHPTLYHHPPLHCTPPHFTTLHHLISHPPLHSSTTLPYPARLTVASALQHPWLGKHRVAPTELSVIANSCYDFSVGLQVCTYVPLSLQKYLSSCLDLSYCVVHVSYISVIINAVLEELSFF
jgi:hypothetical protein